MAASFLTLGTLVIGIGAFVPQSPAQRPDVVAPSAPPSSTPRPPVKDADDAKKPAILGRVLDPDGKPVAVAVVAGQGSLEFGNLSVQYKGKSLGEVKTDAEGRFSLPISLEDGERIKHVELLAGAKGYGLAWDSAPVAGKKVELRLVPEETFVGRLIDLQGVPAGKVRLSVIRVVPEAPKREKLGDGATGDAARTTMTMRLEEMLRQKGFEFRARLAAQGLCPVAQSGDDRRGRGLSRRRFRQGSGGSSGRRGRPLRPAGDHGQAGGQGGEIPVYCRRIG